MIRAWLALILLLGFAQPLAAQPKPRSYQAAVDSVLQNYARDGNFSGAVLVAKDGKVVFRKAYGLADREWRVPNTPDTRFRIGSMTKQFTAAAILKLAEQGKLSLTDPVSKYYPAPPAWSGVTIKHLLALSSGIADYTAVPGYFGLPSRTDLKPEQIIAVVQDKPLQFQPGEKWSYSNTGYILLGYIIEKASGVTYAQYLHDDILAPLRLDNTGYDDTTSLLSKRAHGYDMRDGQFVNAPYLSMTQPYAAGSLYSTVDDLLAWQSALIGGKVVSPASVAAMFTDYGFHYGFGQFIETMHGRRMWDHAGGINGFFSILSRFPDDGLTIAVLSNYTQSDIGRIHNRLGALFLDPAAREGTTEKPKPAELDRYTGRYALEPGGVLTISKQGSRLFAQKDDGAKLELFRELGATFFARVPPYQVTFAAGPESQMITIWRGGQEIVGRRRP